VDHEGADGGGKVDLGERGPACGGGGVAAVSWCEEGEEEVCDVDAGSMSAVDWCSGVIGRCWMFCLMDLWESWHWEFGFFLAGREGNFWINDWVWFGGAWLFFCGVCGAVLSEGRGGCVSLRGTHEWVYGIHDFKKLCFI